jgi:hypothetical protein
MSFSCVICTKNYKSYQSFWNHNKINHPDEHIQISKKVKDFSCTKCNKKFTRKSNLQYHLETACKKKDVVDKTTLLEKELNELKNKFNLFESKTINPSINNSSINNGTVNNIIYINKTGNENLLELNKKEVTEIFDKDLTSVLTFVEKLNFNERLPSNHSFCTTNLEGPYLSVYDSDNSKIKKDRKKYFFEELFSKAVTKMEELYKINKNHFIKDKQKKIEETLLRLNELKKMDMNKKIFKEMLKQMNIISYNDREVVESTWEGGNIKGKIPKTFEEDLDLDSDHIDDSSYNILDTFIPINNHYSDSDSNNDDSDSDSSVLPKLVPTKRIIKKEIII